MSPKLGMARLGIAPSTEKADHSAVAKFDAFQESHGDPTMAELQPCSVEGDHLQMLMNDFGIFLSTEPSLGLGTKKGYFGKIKELLKTKFNTHESWKEEKWYTDLLGQFVTAVKRYDMNDDENTKHDCWPFYLEISDGLVRQNVRNRILHGDTKYAMDGKSLCTLLIKQCIGRPQLKEGPAQKRVWYVLCALAVGRGGEIKHQRYDEWHWDWLFGNVDATWSETKVMQQNPMLFGPTKYSEYGYICDFYHAFGTFFAVENGLERGSDKVTSFSNFVFPQLHDVKSCASKITTFMREYVHPELKAKYSSRSIRKGQTTFLTTTTVSSFELEARGGWVSAIRSNSQSYKECTVSHTMPALNAMTGWSDIRTKKFPPRLECLMGMDSQVEAFMEHLFVVSVESFKGKDGFLRPMLRACTATLLMYHEHILVHFGPTHLLVRKMVCAAEKAKIDENTNATSADTLLKWGAQIRSDFIARNPDCPDCDIADIRDIVTYCTTFIRKMADEHQSLYVGFEIQKVLLQHVATTVDKLQQFLTNIYQKVTSCLPRLSISRHSDTRVSVTPDNGAMSELPVLEVETAASDDDADVDSPFVGE
jgi:hypothetical protein